MTTVDMGATLGIQTAQPVALVEPDHDSKLDQLLARYDEVKAAADAAEKALREITDAIKVELVTAAPGSNDIRVDSPWLSKSLRLFVVKSNRIDSKRLKAEQPALYEAYAKESTAWQLRSVAQ